MDDSQGEVADHIQYKDLLLAKFNTLNVINQNDTRKGWAFPYLHQISNSILYKVSKVETIISETQFHYTHHLVGQNPSHCYTERTRGPFYS